MVVLPTLQVDTYIHRQIHCIYKIQDEHIKTKELATKNLS